MPSALSRPVARRRPILLLALCLLLALLPLASRSTRARAAADGPTPGYWLVGTDGGIFSYGDAGFFGSTGDIRLNQPIAGMAPTSSGRGYWMVASDGGIFAFGDAAFLGSTGDVKLNKPIVGMTTTPSGRGYWMVASDGGIFSFGDAKFFGSTGAVKLNKPIVGMASTPSGQGYWMVASDGGIFAFGDAKFFGSTGAVKLNQPIVAMASTPSGSGYWLSAADGGVFGFGDAGFHGAAPQRVLKPGATRRVAAIVPTPSGLGYWQVAESGEVLAFGDAADLGAPASVNRPVVGMAAVPAGTRVATVDSGLVPSPPETPVETTTTTTLPPLPPAEFFSSVANPTWGVSPSRDEKKKAGRILALAEVGDKIFIAGEHTGMVPPGLPVGGGVVTPRPWLSAIDVNTGVLLPWDAQPDDAVLSLAASPDGKKLYVGGRFTTIGGAPANRLAMLDVETGLQDPTFKSPEPNSSIKAMQLLGDKLFVGGSFEHFGKDRIERGVAALDSRTGALLMDWVPPHNSGGRFIGQTGVPTEDGNPGMIYDMAITGDKMNLIIVGDFLHFGGQGGILVLDTATGAKAAWQADTDRPTYGTSDSAVDPTGFFVATGGTGGQAQSWKVGGPEKPLWIAKVDGDAMDMASTAQRLYLVGHYDFVLGSTTVCGKPPCLGDIDKGDIPNRHLSAFDIRTGKHDSSFTANANTPQGPYVVLIGRNHMYVGGDFTKVNTLPQPGFVQFNALR